MHFNPDNRHILVISGDQSECLEFAKRLTLNLDCVELDNPKKANELLGQEFDAVIFHSHQQFDPNAFGAVTGTIRGGGFLLLLKPEDYPANSLFLRRFTALLNANDVIHHIDPKQSSLKTLAQPPQKAINNDYATSDQKTAVESIKRVVTGHRRRPLVITSDRGRGKSAALGIAAAELQKLRVDNIVICAPSKKSASIVFHHASTVINESNLRFYSPDELLQQKPKADLVMVDEAAAIPLTMLSSFLKQYSRIVFASTQHGYEGSGRGFAINFRIILDNETPEWKSCQLTTPIRWQENDSLEAFSFKALLLNAEPIDSSMVENASISECNFTQVDKLELIKNSVMLKQLFGLLVSAHYQTKPSDLMHLLDDERTSVFCMNYSNSIVAVALVVREGELSKTLSTEIFEGKRRIQGHLVAQSLSANVGIEFASQLSGERIIRIAVHPALQQQGFGKYLLTQLTERSNTDYLSTSYGVTTPLLRFWKTAEFVPVQLGMKRDASSGTHSVIMLHAKTDKGREIQQHAQLYFSENFPHLLSDLFKNLETDIALALLSKQETTLNAENQKRLNCFANSFAGYENNLHLIWKLVCQKLAGNNSLNEAEEITLILKVLQKHSWNSVKEKMRPTISGQKDGLLLLRKAVGKLLD